jgi:hypothetical protein
MRRAALVGPPGAGDYGSASLGSVRIDCLVAAFLLLAAVDHLTLSGGRPRRWYEANVARGINPARWWEYSVSASLMVVLIAMLAGVSELVALIALFGANAAMILFGLVQERLNAERDEVDWRPFIYGCVIGAVPWIAIAAQLIVSTTDGNGVPGFVAAIFITLFLLFNNIRGQHVAAVPWARPLGGAAIRRARLPDPEPRRQERARRRLTRRARATGLERRDACASWHPRPLRRHVASRLDRASGEQPRPRTLGHFGIRAGAGEQYGP